MLPIAGVVALGVYGLLLIVGGVTGYVKAGSKPSLIAGLASGLVAVLSAGLSAAMTSVKLGFGLGLTLAVIMIMFFGSRFGRSRKFMPSGLLGLISLFVAVMLALALAFPPA
jgi:uncharacterized membrane protein (UPF0136 family)